MKNEIYSSKRLREEAERETGKSIIESNGGATRYSSRDKSYSSIIDFFIKVVLHDSGKRSSSWEKTMPKQKLKVFVKGLIITGVFIGVIVLCTYSICRIAGIM